MAPQEAQAPVTEMRILAGLALQPFVTAGAAFLLFPVLVLDRTGQAFARGRPASVVDSAASVAFAVGFVSVPVVVCAVLPALLWFRRRGLLTRFRTLVAGMAFGNVPIVIGYLLAGTYGPIETARTVVYASAIGLSGAAVFWLVVAPAGREREAPSTT
jgi:hypothetical protein